MSPKRWFEVLVSETSEFGKTYEVAHSYEGESLPESGDVIEVVSSGAGVQTRASVWRVDPDDDFPIRALKLED